MNSILVVDDDHELRENIREILAGEGFTVDTAKSGSDALDIVMNREFSLVLLDLVMPGLNGLDTLLLLRRQKPQIRVVLMTAFSTVENAVEAMRRGADDYLTKPFKSSELLMTVRRVLEEAKFKACKAVLDTDGTFNAMANPIRREILRLLGASGAYRFMDLTRELGIDDHTKVNFHLRVLKDHGLVMQDEKKTYRLSAEGEKVTQCLNVVIRNLTS